MTTVYTDEGATWWEGGLNVDADGAPNAYAPRGKGLHALDDLDNAGHPGDWFGLAKDAGGEPYVQGVNGTGPYKYFYIPETALQNKTKKTNDTERYVDSTKVPYLSIPRNARAVYAAKYGTTDYGLEVGDVGLAYCRKTGRLSAAVVGDVGPKGKWGEGSIALAEALGIPSSPINGGAESGIVVVVFKRSSRGWPRGNQEVAGHAQDLLNALGGPAKYGIA